MKSEYLFLTLGAVVVVGMVLYYKNKQDRLIQQQSYLDNQPQARLQQAGVDAVIQAGGTLLGNVLNFLHPNTSGINGVPTETATGGFATSDTSS